MKHLKLFSLLLGFLIFLPVVNINSNNTQENPSFEIHIIEYSKSLDYDVHYIFNSNEMKIYEQDKVDETKQNTLRHRTLLGKDKKKLDAYLQVFVKMKFKEEYTDKDNKYKGARNQKRISYSYKGESHSVLISNVYNEDINNFIIFLNDFIYSARNSKFQTNDYRMAEFVK